MNYERPRSAIYGLADYAARFRRALPVSAALCLAISLRGLAFAKDASNAQKTGKVNAAEKETANQKVKPASKETIELVHVFIKTPTAQLPAEKIPEFMEINPDSLPKKLRVRYLAKREELLALKKLAESRKKNPVRRAGQDSPPPAESCPKEPPEFLTILPLAGYGRIQYDEEEYLQEKTKCSECELIAEFSLRKVAKPKSDSSKPDYVYFLHGMDPLNSLIAMYHAGRKNPFGTNFFGMGYPTCH